MKISILFLVQAALCMPPRQIQQENEGAPITVNLIDQARDKGVDTLPHFPKPLAKLGRMLGFYGDMKSKEIGDLRASNGTKHWLRELNNPENFFIRTKDGVMLDTIYVPKDGANYTMIFWGGILKILTKRNAWRL